MKVKLQWGRDHVSLLSATPGAAPGIKWASNKMVSHLNIMSSFPFWLWGNFWKSGRSWWHWDFENSYSYHILSLMHRKHGFVLGWHSLLWRETAQSKNFCKSLCVKLQEKTLFPLLSGVIKDYLCSVVCKGCYEMPFAYLWWPQ